MNTVVKTHIGSYGIIIKDEKIALIRKARGGYKGKLDLPGGGIEHTETPEETLIRELQEEADVTVINKELFDVTSTNILWQMTEDTKEHINPTGKFEIGGPHGDSGLTGRKIIVDTYGGYAHHGGGAFSGKDCTKVDRSACYMARYIAKNIVASGLAEKCEIQLSYAIGVAEPTSVMVDTFGRRLSTET